MMLAQIEDPRTALQRLIDERKEDYAGLSRMLRRNDAYNHLPADGTRIIPESAEVGSSRDCVVRG